MAQSEARNRMTNSQSGNGKDKAGVQYGLTDAQVRSRAYEIYESRCDNDHEGDELGDWLAAEQELQGHDSGARRRSRREIESREASFSPRRPYATSGGPLDD